MPTFTNGADTYTVSGTGTFNLDFLGGDDTLTVNGGTSTTAHMGTGNDHVLLKLGPATVDGDAGADKIDVWSSNATVNGGDDNDLINLRGGTGLAATGGLGADRFTFFADTSGVSLDGGGGNDIFNAGGHSVTGTILGGAANDYFVGFVAGATLRGGTGNDVYRATVGSAATFAESADAGTDAVQVARGSSYTIPDNIENLSVQGFTGSTTSAATLTGNTFDNAIVGHNNAETILGMDGNDRISSQGGNDTVYGGSGNDVLVGGTGIDTLFGEAGSDTLRGAGSAAMSGGAGNDVYYVDSDDDVATENAASGTDTVRVTDDVADISSPYVLPANIEIGIIIGGDPLTQSFLAGNGLDNLLIGNVGPDVLDGSDGDDELRGGAGFDQLHGDDYDEPGTGKDLLIGGDGDDILGSNGGDDTMIGGNGDDRLAASSGNDLLIGGLDQDSITTGGGADVIVYQQAFDALLDNSGTYFRENIDDFDVGLDKIDLSAVDADLNSDFSQPFHFTGATADGTTGDVWLEEAEDPGWYFLWAENSGDGVPDMAILLFLPGGIASFTADNLIL